MDSLDKNFLLAIGYQKTGSTWLDHHLWAHPQIGFYNVKSRALRQIIVGTRPLEFNLTHCRAQVRQRLPLIPANKMPVIGMERLCGSPHSGGYDSKEIADRLANLFPNAKVLIVIREQHQMILSTYNQSVKGGNSMTLHEYITESQSGRYAVPHFDRARFCYHHLINYYIARFGRANVLVLPYEQFCTTPRTFVEQIVRFAGITVDDALIDTLPFTQRTRTSFSPRAVTVLRQFNAWVGQRNQFTPHPILP
ncbi:MAG: sulfotransferase, partial [Caldilineaceae bacterium]|nr:sulfotransferase [Caldilineaceae bacterium]